MFDESIWDHQVHNFIYSVTEAVNYCKKWDTNIYMQVQSQLERIPTRDHNSLKWICEKRTCGFGYNFEVINVFNQNCMICNQFYNTWVNKRNTYIIAKTRKIAQAGSKLHTVLVSCIRQSKHGGMDWTSLALEIKMTVCEEQSKIRNESMTAKITY